MGSSEDVSEVVISFKEEQMISADLTFMFLILLSGVPKGNALQ